MVGRAAVGALEALLEALELIIDGEERLGLLGLIPAYLLSIVFRNFLRVWGGSGCFLDSLLFPVLNNYYTHRSWLLS